MRTQTTPRSVQVPFRRQVNSELLSAGMQIFHLTSKSPPLLVVTQSSPSAPRRSLFFQFYLPRPVATHVAAMSTQACC